MDLKKLAKILKNSNFDEDEIYDVLQNKDTDFFKNYTENKDKIEFSNYKQALNSFNRKQKKLLNDEEAEFKKMYEDYEAIYDNIVNQYKRGKRRIEREQQMEQYNREQEQIIQQRNEAIQEQQRILQEQQRLLNEQLEALQRPQNFITKTGLNKSQKLNYINIMTERNFNYAKNPNGEKPLKENPKRLLNQLIQSVEDMNLPANTKFFLNFDGISGQKTYKSGITLEEIEQLAETFDMSADDFFSEYKFDNAVYGVSVSYK